MEDEFLLAIPVYNEERYVDRVIRETQLYCDHILVVDDGSTDATTELLRKHRGIEVVTHGENLGYGASLASAFDFATDHGYRWLITMDCDEQHEPEQIPRFILAAKQDDSDIISGTRYPDGHHPGGAAPADRREINQKITRMINAKLGFSLTDSFCGFKAYRVAALSEIEVTVPGYAMPMQFWVQAARAGLRVGELSVPLIYHDASRSFGSVLDDPEVRVQHYLEVFEMELCKTPCPTHATDVDCVPCR